MRIFNITGTSDFNNSGFNIFRKGRYNAYVSLTSGLKFSHNGALKVLSMTEEEYNDLAAEFKPEMKYGRQISLFTHM